MRVVFTPVFVEFIPEKLEDHKLYVSESYATAVHKCACGCGQKVVTPLSPTRWTLKVVDGRVSLDPSIGNWSFPCRSHYYIKRNEVRWSYDMPQSAVEAGRRSDARMRQRYYDREADARNATAESIKPMPEPRPVESLWQRLKKWFLGVN